MIQTNLWVVLPAGPEGLGTAQFGKVSGGAWFNRDPTQPEAANRERLRVLWVRA